MQRERVTDDIFVFTSDLYAQVTATAIRTDDGMVLIDTLAYPEESKQIKYFLEEKLKQPVRYVVNTHFHADHTTGTCFFPEAKIIGHALCRELLDERGRQSLERVKESSVEMGDVELVLPNMVFEDRLTLYFSDKTLEFWHLPGHSPDLIACHIPEAQVLVASDAMMPVPYFVNGNYSNLIDSLTHLQAHSFEFIIQGHGEVVLRGEVEEKIQSDLDYLVQLREYVGEALESAAPTKALNAIEIEKCGKSRVLMNGAVQQLHRQNVTWLAEQGREHIQLQP